MSEFLTPEEAIDVLRRADEKLRKHLGQYKGVNATWKRYHHASECYLSPIAQANEGWENFGRELRDEVSSITNAINTEKGLKGKRQLLGQVYNEAVESWQASPLMLNLHTGKIPGGTKQNPLKVDFSVAYEVR